ncbi:toxin [Pseudomonas sp. MPR-ANC1]|uniref:RHS repeat domain-containing protein n=1 Tax=Pseudomonas sp. MPR-ANC1 TaxID=2075548 RepID=UPI000CD0F42F|nr:RHS repeat-associated core domain-containing protein [Pseudomonas sp. MPR-ANC1]POA44373.1 toxin [Pseudomonas sp. MPR-ANC1]
MTATVHSRTPSLAVSDGRGLPIRQVGYLRSVAGAEVTALISRQCHDVNGRLVEQWDPRLPAPNLSTVYGLAGEALKVASVDAGWRLSLPGLAAEPLQRWDERGGHWRSTFDDQLRVVAVEGRDATDVDSFIYADASADAGLNLRGQLLEQKDPSGALRLNGYALSGQPLSETRSFLDGEAFTSRRVFNPLGAVLEQIDAGDHRQQSNYGLAGQLRQVQLLVNGKTKSEEVLLDAQYNAEGKIIEQLAGNGVRSRWTYDPANGRLRSQSSHKDAKALQDFEYFYDPAGNITRIEDHAFQPIWFANQLVDGHRDFSYDSLYRLISASGYDDGPLSDIPGLPQPTDPNNRLNYTQTYTYDAGGNLTELVHVRAGASYTRQMRIDPTSNRGVRWQPGDAEPVFDTLFDRHGNLLAVQPGQPLQWNARDELQNVTLIHREGGQDDAEHYHYSQGQRVFKRHETFSGGAGHFAQVRYLPGLEIRSKDNGEELHVISVGNARCLHWAKAPPADIDNNQLRYSLEDHLGSCSMELDHNAQTISEEGYYPFGATAWMAAAIEVSYKFVRYSGKEMDVSGLYYYGARYYAPWLQRWVSADPAGDVDGLNLYGFVGNNPLRYVDQHGKQKEERVIVDYSTFITGLGNYASSMMDLMDAVAHKKKIGQSLLKNLVGESINAAIGFIGGYLGSQAFDFLLPDDPHVANFTNQSKPMFTQGLVGGNIGAEIAGAVFGQVIPSARLIGPLIPQTSKMTVQAIDRELGIDTSSEPRAWVQTFIGIFLNNVVGSVVPGVNVALGMGSRVQEAEDIKTGLDPAKLLKIEKLLDSWELAVRQRSANAEKAFVHLNQPTVSSGSQLIVRRDQQAQTKVVLGMIESTRTTVSWMRQDATTDNRFLMKQARELKRSNDRH